MWPKLNQIDSFLNQTTMYRLVEESLWILIGWAVIGALWGKIGYSPLAVMGTTALMVVSAVGANYLLARFFGAVENKESATITALILVLIVPPVATIGGMAGLAALAAGAMISKFLLAIGNKHIFNPAAIAVVVSSVLFNLNATWWVGNLWMTPVVAISGFLIVRKLRREKVMGIFLAAASGLTLLSGLSQGIGIITIIETLLFHSSLLFMALFMVTEPLTSPTTQKNQIIFSLLAAVLFWPNFHIGSWYSTPEIALIVANLYAYIVNNKAKLVLTISQPIKLTDDTYDFVFPLEKKIKYLPGQYMEFTLAHQSDNRGNRRYFTLASSPTENELRIGVKFYDTSSSFKKALLAEENEMIAVSQLAGDFVLPKDRSKKLVFIAGGIGITPFRSMIKYLIDKNEKRDIVLLYSNKTKNEIVYKDVFDEAEKKLRIKTIYVNTTEVGRIDDLLIKKEIADYQSRQFYLSGPHGMVTEMEKVLLAMDLGRQQITTDFFPGFA